MIDDTGISPIDKSGDITYPTSFRPISTLSAFTQVFEKREYKQVISYIDKHGLLSHFQFRFRKGRSTEQATEEIADPFRSPDFETNSVPRNQVFILSLSFQTEITYSKRLCRLNMLPITHWHEHMDHLQKSQTKQNHVP